MDKELVRPGCSVPGTEQGKARASALDVEVSCFNSYATPSNPVTVNLLTWLSSGKYRKEVGQIRGAVDKAVRDRLKGRLPAITPSGVFSYRSESGLIRHSGLLQFDIDLKENRHVGNFYELKRQIGNIPNVAYCGLSVSGQGFWGLVPIAHKEIHKGHFEALRRAFLLLGIMIDEKPKNVSSLRGYSFDDAPYFNHQAAVFTRYELPEREKFASYSSYRPSGGSHTPTKEKVEACLDAMERSGTDITSSYAAWFQIGCSLANEFGEGGRGYFHQVSQLHPQYSFHRTEKQYNSCLKGDYSYTIATFFEYCKRDCLL